MKIVIKLNNLKYRYDVYQMFNIYYPLDEIKKELDEQGYSVKYVLNTHGHFDHVLGELEIQQNYPEIPIYISKDDTSHFSRLEQELKMFGFNVSVQPLNPTEFIDESTQLSIGKYPIQIFSTPGHSKGSLTYYVDNKLFTGDALFYRSIGRTDFLGGSYNELINSIETKLMPLENNINEIREVL